MAGAEANRMVLVEEEVEIARTVAFSLGTIEEMAERAGIDCRCELPDDLPRFFGDAAKLRQILISLISNAVKFTPAEGEVRVTIEREPDDGLAFRVADTGIGIPRDKLSVALAPFGQIDGGLAGTMASASAYRSPSGWSSCMAARWKSPAGRGKAPR
jgi:signal transduction histidine kinase